MTAGCTFFAPGVGVPNGCDASPAACAAPPSDAGATVSFKRDIRPLMNRLRDDPTGSGCASCHYPNAIEPIGIWQARMDLSSLGSLRKGGSTTQQGIVVPGDPDRSGLVQKLRGTYPTGKRMPFVGPPYWSDAQIQLVVDWIAQGALGDDSE